MPEPAIARLDGRIAVVTGGGGSLGRAVGRTVAAAGGDVALADLDGDRAAAAAAAVRREHPGRRALGLAMDVRDGASVARGFDAVARELGGPDVLVTAAGDNVAPRSFLSISLDTWQATMAARGVTVNALAPGCFWSAPYDGLPPERLERLRSTIPVGRIADPMEIASAVAYLASDAGGYTTGEVLSANGGFASCAHVDEPPRVAHA